MNVAVLFYDAPSPPPGLFDDFLTNNSKTEVFTRSFLSLVQSSNANSTWGLRWVTQYLAEHLAVELTIHTNRSAFNTISVLGYTEDILNYMLNETLVSSWPMAFPRTLTVHSIIVLGDQPSPGLWVCHFQRRACPVKYLQPHHIAVCVARIKGVTILTPQYCGRVDWRWSD